MKPLLDGVDGVVRLHIVDTLHGDVVLYFLLKTVRWAQGGGTCGHGQRHPHCLRNEEASVYSVYTAYVLSDYLNVIWRERRGREEGRERKREIDR